MFMTQQRLHRDELKQMWETEGGRRRKRVFFLNVTLDNRKRLDVQQAEPVGVTGVGIALICECHLSACKQQKRAQHSAT